MGGIVIFVESIRWLGHRWGMRAAQRGLGAAGFLGEFRYWKWHSSWRGWLVLPAAMDHAMLEREAQRLAAYVTQRRETLPNEPIHLMGYSFGGYIALRALELLLEGTQVDSVAILAAAFSPHRDLTAACRAVKGPLVVSSSIGDAAIVGLGTLVFGAGDGHHTLSVGMVGNRTRGPVNLRKIRWRPEMIRLGNFGGHFSAVAWRFIQRCIAPAMEIGKKYNFGNTND